MSAFPTANGWHGSLTETGAAQEVAESCVRAKPIEAGSDQDAWVKPLFVAFFKPPHRLVGIPKRNVDDGDLRRIRLARA